MVIKSLKIETESSYNWDDVVYVSDVNVKLIKIIKRKSKIGVDIFYIRYKLDNNIKPFYLVINQLYGHIEKIEGSSDIVNVFDEIWKYIEQRITANRIWKFVEEKFIFDNEDNKTKDYNKLRFSSNLDLPLNTIIKFRALTLVINCIIEKDGKYYSEIYLDEGFYVQD